ncbi:MAG: hypothetical protein HC927_06430, partial [Deltaproteobacteria bacterium]|nr:hypothetical protein [Deltaproteobacteria bacterium]
DLRLASPLLQASTAWALAVAARERGDYDECADRFLAIAERYRNHDRRTSLFEHAAECRASKARAAQGRTK